MRDQKKRERSFKELLETYLEIKGLDIIILLADGKEIELYKNRTLINNEIVTHDKLNRVKRIPLSKIKSIDMYAA